MKQLGLMEKRIGVRFLGLRFKGLGYRVSRSGNHLLEVELLLFDFQLHRFNERLLALCREIYGFRV
jgi:hypothetical protein